MITQFTLEVKGVLAEAWILPIFERANFYFENEHSGKLVHDGRDLEPGQVLVLRSLSGYMPKNCIELSTNFFLATFDPSVTIKYPFPSEAIESSRG